MIPAVSSSRECRSRSWRRPKTLAVTARFADAWLTYGDTSYQDTTAAATEAVVRAQSEQLGRGLRADRPRPERRSTGST